MKILSFGGGLGNQIFCYAFYLYMKEKYPKEKIYGLYSSKKLSEHHGLEIDKWFDVDLPPQRWYSTALCAILYLWKQMVGNTRFVETHRDYCKNEKAIAFLAFKFTNRYFPKHEWIHFKIKKDTLCEKNREILKSIHENNSVFIHVRRGDFLSERYRKLFEGTCPIEYYELAIKQVLEKIANPVFYVFSDDQQWAKKNLPIYGNRAFFIDWNIGRDSPIDMYLMSQCKNAIMANSTFSFWGAYLGVKKNLVFFPKKWNNGVSTPIIFEKEWIAY